MSLLAVSVQALWRDEDGAQPSEYALVFGVVAVALLIIFSPMGSSRSLFNFLDRAAICVLQWRCA